MGDYFMKQRATAFFHNRKVRLGLLIALIVLVVLAIILGMTVSSMLTFDDTGAHVIDKYGILAAESGSGSGGSAEAPAAGDEVDGSAVVPDEEEEEEPEDSNAIRAVTVSAKSLATDSKYQAQLLSLIEKGTIDTVIVDLKTINGYITCDCTTDAVNLGSIKTSYAVNMDAAVKSLKDAGARMIGRIYCFMDNHATKTNHALAVQTDNGYVWLDYQNNRWLNPESDEAVQYLCDVITAGAQMGCDEFLLQNFCYPTNGKLDLIGYTASDAEAHSQVLAEDFQRMQQAAGALPVGLYLNSVTEEDPLSGVTLAAFYDMAERICLPLAYETEEGIGDVAQQFAAQAGSSDKFTPVFTGSYGWSSVPGTAILNTDASSYAIYDLS